MSSKSHDPIQLGEVLRNIAQRFRRADFDAIEVITERWNALVPTPLSDQCRPLMVVDGVLNIGVPNGAFAQRISEMSEDILVGLSDLGDRAPRALKVTFLDR